MEKKNREENEYIYMPSWEEIPNVDLYLDQVVNLLEKYLKPFYLVEEEKVITKTMINNYVKQNIIEAPVKKKYNKDQIGILFVICILKQVYSINDIANLINLSLKNNTVEEGYNNFRRVFEKCVKGIFCNKFEIEEEDPLQDKYILKCVVGSFVSKLYVEKNYLVSRREKKNKKRKE